MKKKSFINSAALKWIIASVAIPLIIVAFNYWNSRQARKKTPGVLKIEDIQVIQTPIEDVLEDPEKNKCLVDFRVINTGGSTVLINKVQFKVVDFVKVTIKGYLDYSKVYDLDISSLDSVGEIASVSVSQEIKAGELDRFGINLIAKDAPEGFEIGWRFQPTLFTNYGEVIGDTIEVWFPYENQSNDPEYFKKAKQYEREEKKFLDSIQKALKTPDVNP